MTVHPKRRSKLLVENRQIIILIGLFLFAFAVRLLPGPRTIDDSFITFRYARNILAGNGFVYNPGEQVLGTTTPFYTILLTVVGLFTGGINAPFPTIALTINAIADGLTCALLFLLGKRLSAPIPGLGAALVWAIAPFSVSFSIGGLETSIYVLLMVSIMYSYLTDHYIRASFLAALALLTRPDALLLLAPLAADRLWVILRGKSPDTGDSEPMRIKERIKASWTFYIPEVTAFFLPILIWLVFSVLYFGSPIPHSIAAKSLVYRLPSNAAFIRLIQHYATPFLEHISFGVSWIGVGLVLYPFLFLVGALHSYRTTHRAWPFIVYPWLYFVVFAMANPLIFRWYLTPPLPALILLILIGLDGVLHKLLSALGSSFSKGNSNVFNRASNTFIGLLVVIAPFTLSLRGWVIKPDHGLTRPAPQMAWYQLELLYRQAAGELALVLADHAPETTIAAGDVGVLGFYTGARILDTVGLISPQSLRYYPLDQSYYEINYAIPPDLIAEIQPDYVVILEVYGRKGLLVDPRFQQAYMLWRKIPTDIYGSDGLLIFERLKQ